MISKAMKQILTLLGIVALLVGCVAGGAHLGYIGLPLVIMYVFDPSTSDILDTVLGFYGMVGAVIGGITGFLVGLVFAVKRFNHGRKESKDEQDTGNK